ncbi:MAG: MOSC domain-containing protein [Bacteroidia bacterium]|nr:MOSC domain-containing protein [Bacteroidia bacterium]
MWIPLTTEELEKGLDLIRQAPKNNGTIEMVVRRPKTGEREVIEEVNLDHTEGLIGDNWKTRGSSRTPDGSAHPDMQLNIMNSRAIALIAQDKQRWQLAGDQIFIDMDLSGNNLPPGTRLKIGTAIIEVSVIPHNGCKKFVERFGLDAMKFVNSPIGKQLHLRGINAKIVQSGVVKVGNVAQKINK